MSVTRILFLVSLVILTPCGTQQFANSAAAADREIGGRHDDSLRRTAAYRVWTLRLFDKLGSNGNIRDYTELHAKYCEEQFYNVETSDDFSAVPHITRYAMMATRVQSRDRSTKAPYTTTNRKWSGTNPNAITNLAIGRGWTGNLSNPSTYVGNLDVYSIDYYARCRE